MVNQRGRGRAGRGVPLGQEPPRHRRTGRVGRDGRGLPARRHQRGAADRGRPDLGPARPRRLGRPGLRRPHGRVDGLKDEAAAAVADTEALASDAWTGLENGGPTPVDQGVAGLWGGLRERYDAQRDGFLDALGLSEQEADEQARAGRTALVPALAQAHAEGVPLDPVVLAHLEAARRARRRGRRSLGMSLGPRAPADPGDRP